MHGDGLDQQEAASKPAVEPAVQPDSPQPTDEVLAEARSLSGI